MRRAARVGHDGATMPENGTAHGGYRGCKAGGPSVLSLGVAQGSPQAATPTRLFPRFRRLKRSSAAAHNAHGWTARYAVPTRFWGGNGGWMGLLAWMGLVCQGCSSAFCQATRLV